MPWPTDPESRRRSNTTYNADYRRARKQALERAGHRCEQCGSRRHLETHHPAGAAADPAHRHLQVLCATCHAKITAQQGGGYRAGRPTDPDPRPRTAW